MDAIEAAFLHALGCEVRTRAAENRAANAVADQRIAEADARISEQRMQLAQNLERETEREIRDIRSYRSFLLSAVEEVARGNKENAIRIISQVADGSLSSEGEDAWACQVTVIHQNGRDSLSVCTYWSVYTLKAIMEERYNIPIWDQMLMHAGIELPDHSTLSEFDLFSRAHHPDDLRVFILSRRTPP